MSSANDYATIITDIVNTWSPERIRKELLKILRSNKELGCPFIKAAPQTKASVQVLRSQYEKALNQLLGEYAAHLEEDERHPYWERYYDWTCDSDFCERACNLMTKFAEAFPSIDDLLEALVDMDEQFSDFESDVHEVDISYYKEGIKHLLESQWGDALFEHLLELAPNNDDVGDILVDCCLGWGSTAERIRKRHNIPVRLAPLMRQRIAENPKDHRLVDGYYRILESFGASEAELSAYRHEHIDSKEMEKLELEARRKSGNIQSELAMLEAAFKENRLSSTDVQRLFNLLEETGRTADALMLARQEFSAELCTHSHAYAWNSPGDLYFWLNAIKRLMTADDWRSFVDDLLKRNIPDDVRIRMLSQEKQWDVLADFLFEKPAHHHNDIWVYLNELRAHCGERAVKMLLAGIYGTVRGKEAERTYRRWAQEILQLLDDPETEPLAKAHLTQLRAQAPRARKLWQTFAECGLCV